MSCIWFVYFRVKKLAFSAEIKTAVNFHIPFELESVSRESKGVRVECVVCSMVKERLPSM